MTRQQRSRSVASLIWDLYRDPASVWRALTKAVTIARRHGVKALATAVSRKIEHPERAVLDLLRPEPVAPLPLERRSLSRGRGLTGQHSVSIIILTRGNARLIHGCLTSLAATIDETALLDIIIVNNGQELAAPQSVPWPVRLIRATAPFNWSAYNNSAARLSAAEYLLFLNDDTEAITRGWLDAMVATSLSNREAIVGAKLIYPDGMIQHLGVQVDADGEARHLFRNYPRQSRLVPTEPQPAQAVTGACLLTPRALFDSLGGFYEQLAVAYNDLDYCLRARAAGHNVMVDPGAELVHLETQTRTFHPPSTDANVWRRRVSAVL
jgi:GT2 family glycosyltransferase